MSGQAGFALRHRLGLLLEPAARMLLDKSAEKSFKDEETVEDSDVRGNEGLVTAMTVCHGYRTMS